MKASPTKRGPTWDISRLAGESAAGRSAWTESYAARALGLALAAQPEFWQHVATIREDRAQVGAFARRYVRRNIGRRRELLEHYLLSAADANHTDHRYELIAITTIGLAAWFVTGDPSPDAPRRALRPEAAETIAVGAIRVARRGAGRCLAPDCSGGDGAKLRAGNDSYCSVCRLILDLPSRLAALAESLAKCAEPSKAAELRRETEKLAEPAKVQRAAQLCRPRWQEEAERALFDAAIPVVLPDAASRPRTRRRRRTA